MTAGDAVVSVRDLTKRFAVRRTWREMFVAPRGGTETTAVDRITFDVRQGEIFGLLGQNGAGKTTVFKMLSTLILPNDGSASVVGHDVVREPNDVRRALAPVIANERSLYWRLTAHENVRLFAALQGLSGRAMFDEIARVLRIVSLTDTGEKLVGAFSSGMRQRLLIARALIGRPRVLLLDEPTRSLDPISARDFRAFLRDEIVKAEGCTVLLATHDADEVWDLCDRVGVLERGRLLEVDATARLRERTGSNRYRAWVRTDQHTAAAERARAAGVAVSRTADATEAGWTELEFDVAGGADAASRVVGALSANGAAVARFERVAPSLADLIERVVARSAHGGTHA
ncbi:MAG TPA: ABC transporter ATP-binding protein [Gemmatimonadaceae bacterium]|nr:ABC transporter ATP-binding protein [Gemmatimonadaceae bacterium]